MHHTVHAQYVIRESRSIIVGIIFLITVDRLAGLFVGRNSAFGLNILIFVL